MLLKGMGSIVGFGGIRKGKFQKERKGSHLGIHSSAPHHIAKQVVLEGGLIQPASNVVNFFNSKILRFRFSAG